ncbi:MAG: hypothetical protein L6R28_21880 [Planctomycetes bacterium]|nr:hypothetical protein [Planctomycetota bacterium]
MAALNLQEAMLNLIEAAGHWGTFNGPNIARSLRENRNIWRAVLLVGPAQKLVQDSATGKFVREESDYSGLRGLPENLYGYDRVHLAPALGQEDKLEALANSWDPESVDWIRYEEANTAVEARSRDDYMANGGDPKRVVLEIWWD